MASGGAGVVASAGLGLATASLPPTDAVLDTLMVAGGQGVEQAAADPALLDWVRLRAMHARRVASVCTGAFLLAAAGLLDGRRAVTHWSVCDDLARRFPAVHVEPDPIFIHDGPVWTSAGVTAGIDLALALVEEDLGRAMALAVARYLVVFLKRPGGQAQFSAALSLQAADDRFAALHDWINGHLASDLSLGALARQAGMSERSFMRRYTAATGVTPARAVERLRVEAVRHLLWHGWHRHISLVMLAFAMTATIRHHANQAAPQKTPPRPARTRQARTRQTPSAGPPRKSAALPPALPREASSLPSSSPGPSDEGRTRPAHSAHT